jgi:hypothetical protein
MTRPSFVKETNVPNHAGEGRDSVKKRISKPLRLVILGQEHTNLLVLDENGKALRE